MSILKVILSEKHIGLRLDKVLAEVFPDFSRSFLQEAIKNGYILVNGTVPRPRDIVCGKEMIAFDAAQAIGEQQIVDTPEDIAIDIVYEDEDLLLINKPAGLVVHPAAGHPQHTLVNALLHRRASLQQLPRAGIVHRLDKDTSGLLLVAGNHKSYQYLNAQMQQRNIQREYLCLATGDIIAGGTIDAAIGRHPKDRKRMAVNLIGGKPAITHYRVEQRFRGYTLLKVRLETGRTHQIRVHLAYIRHPVFGDPVYGGRHRPLRSADARIASVLTDFKRQALHAIRLELTHPATRKNVSWQIPLSEDMQNLIDSLSVEK